MYQSTLPMSHWAQAGHKGEGGTAWAPEWRATGGGA
jgi:hypothetical protein